MPSSIPDLDTQQFSIDQRLQSISQLWDSIPDSLHSLPVPEWHRQELERRLAEARARSGAGSPWERVKARLEGRP